MAAGRGYRILYVVRSDLFYRKIFPKHSQAVILFAPREMATILDSKVRSGLKTMPNTTVLFCSCAESPV